MSIPTHVLFLPVKHLRLYLSNGAIRTTFLQPLGSLDGVELTAMTLQKLPRPGWPEDISEYDLENSSMPFIQAGGSRDRMTIEILEEPPEGGHLFTVGREDVDSVGLDVRNEIAVGETVVSLSDVEIFGAEEAADLFHAFHQSGKLPPGYSLRKR